MRPIIYLILLAFCTNAQAQTEPTKPDTVANCQFKELDGTKKPIYKEGTKWYILRTLPNGKTRKQYVSKSVVEANTTRNP